MDGEVLNDLFTWGGGGFGIIVECLAIPSVYLMYNLSSVFMYKFSRVFICNFSGVFIWVSNITMQNVPNHGNNIIQRRNLICSLA